MRAFMDKDFLLTTDTAKHLFHDIAKDMPIIDYHCHLVPQEIYEDIHFENITQVWLGADHYKWRLMRSYGVEERYITGDASDREKFQKYAETIGVAIGNPLYHWSHMELRNYFGYEGILNGDTAEDVWNLCNAKIAGMSARRLIVDSNVKALCTTDDPADSLEWHTKLREDGFSVQVCPTFRPDKAMNPDKPDYVDYIAKLSAAAGVAIVDYKSLIAALQNRADFFETNGCRISDHGLEAVMYAPASAEEVNAIFVKRLAGTALTELELKQFRTALLLDLGRIYAKKGWVMQLHYGVIRDNSKRVANALGPDAGVDSIGPQASVKELAYFLNALDINNELPKTIIYSLNPIDNTAIETVMGGFQTSEACGKIQHGSAWWFNDNKQGMIDQMTSLANEGMLAGFVGMLTDSRSFLSYARHEYFRRILCELIGGWVENGEFPNDEKALRTIIEGICYKNAEKYLNF